MKDVPQIFKKAFQRVIGHEGGFQNDPDDRGNWTTGKIGSGDLKGTKFGISAMAYPNVDIKNLTVEEAETIYYQDYFCKMGGTVAHPSLVYQMFDASVNHGVHRATQFLQRAVGEKDDGVFGDKTEAATKAMDHNDVLLNYLAERLDFMNDIRTWDKYGRGWSQRIAENLRLAARDN